MLERPYYLHRDVTFPKWKSDISTVQQLTATSSSSSTGHPETEGPEPAPHTGGVREEWTYHTAGAGEVCFDKAAVWSSFSQYTRHKHPGLYIYLTDPLKTFSTNLWQRPKAMEVVDSFCFSQLSRCDSAAPWASWHSTPAPAHDMHNGDVNTPRSPDPLEPFVPKPIPQTLESFYKCWSASRDLITRFSQGCNISTPAPYRFSDQTSQLSEGQQTDPKGFLHGVVNLLNANCNCQFFNCLLGMCLMSYYINILFLLVRYNSVV